MTRSFCQEDNTWLIAYRNLFMTGCVFRRYQGPPSFRPRKIVLEREYITYDSLILPRKQHEGNYAIGTAFLSGCSHETAERKVYEQWQLVAFVWVVGTVWNIFMESISAHHTMPWGRAPRHPWGPDPPLEAAGMSMRDSATSAMRGWEHGNPGKTGWFRVGALSGSADFAGKLRISTLRLKGSQFVYQKAVPNKPQNKKLLIWRKLFNNALRY
jgi:hypothetical protein